MLYLRQKKKLAIYKYLSVCHVQGSPMFQALTVSIQTLGDILRMLQNIFPENKPTFRFSWHPRVHQASYFQICFIQSSTTTPRLENHVFEQALKLAEGMTCRVGMTRLGISKETTGDVYLCFQANKTHFWSKKKQPTTKQQQQNNKTTNTHTHTNTHTQASSSGAFHFSFPYRSVLLDSVLEGHNDQLPLGAPAPVGAAWPQGDGGVLRELKSQTRPPEKDVTQISFPETGGLDWWIGLDWFGLVWIGLDWFGLVWIGLDWFGLVWIGLDWFGLVWIGLDWFGLVWIGLVWIGLDWWFGLVWIGGLDWWFGG